MSEVDPKVLAALGRLAERVSDLDPRVRELLEQLKLGRSEGEVLAQLTKMTAEDPELAKRIEDAARAEFQPLREEADTDIKESVVAIRTLKDRQDALRALNFEEEDLEVDDEGEEEPEPDEEEEDFDDEI